VTVAPSAELKSTVAGRLATACARLEDHRGAHPSVPGWKRLEPIPAARGDGPLRLADRAIGWLEAQLAWFDPDCWEKYLPRRLFPAGPILELLLVCRELRDQRLDSHAAFVGRVLELAQRVVTRSDVVEGLHRTPQLFTYHAWLIVLLERLCGSAGGLRSVVEAQLAAGRTGISSPAGAAVRALELRHVLDLGDMASDLPSTSELFGRWWSEHTHNPLAVADGDAYALTHAVFYATDFGRTPLPLATRDRRELGELALVLMGAALARCDADLGAELLHIARIAGSAREPGGAAGWTRLARMQRADGAVPGPLWERETERRLSGERAAAYVFGTAYHTTIVTTLAALDRQATEPGARAAS